MPNFADKFLKPKKNLSTNKRYNTRIAPSPTGHAHLGTMRTALFNYLAASTSGGSFVLRIDDTDNKRNDEAAIQPIYDSLAWLGIHPSYSLRQSDRTDRYLRSAATLLECGYATMLPNGAVALKWHDGMPKSWHDNIAGDIAINQTNIDQIDGKLILLKGKDNNFDPTYQFASVVDDMYCKINYIIRGTDHISNTPKQLAIWWAIQQTKFQDFQPPEFAHIGLVFKDGKKLSKRDHAASMLSWRDEGIHPAAMINFMLRLGWSPTKDDASNEFISGGDLVSKFLREGRMKNSPINMDIAKLHYYDKHYKVDGYKYNPDRVVLAQAHPEFVEEVDEEELQDEPNFPKGLTARQREYLFYLKAKIDEPQVADGHNNIDGVVREAPPVGGPVGGVMAVAGGHRYNWDWDAAAGAHVVHQDDAQNQAAWAVNYRGNHVDFMQRVVQNLQGPRIEQQDEGNNGQNG